MRRKTKVMITIYWKTLSFQDKSEGGHMRARCRFHTATERVQTLWSESAAFLQSEGHPVATPLVIPKKAKMSWRKSLINIWAPSRIYQAHKRLLRLNQNPHLITSSLPPSISPPETMSKATSWRVFTGSSTWNAPKITTTEPPSIPGVSRSRKRQACQLRVASVASDLKGKKE